MKTVFFDLDGTLLDAKKRLFTLFNDLSGNEILNFDDYWELKRSMYGHPWILEHFFNYTQNQMDAFTTQWLDLIEDEKYLNLDTLFVDTISTLDEKLADSLYVVSARQSETNAIQQLEKLGISHYFSDVLITKNTESKESLIRSKVPTLSAKSIFVGDTGMDILTGKKLNMPTVAVLTGFRNKTQLMRYQPDYIIPSLTELKSIVEND